MSKSGGRFYGCPTLSEGWVLVAQGARARRESARIRKKVRGALRLFAVCLAFTGAPHVMVLSALARGPEKSVWVRLVWAHNFRYEGTRRDLQVSKSQRVGVILSPPWAGRRISGYVLSGCGSLYAVPGLTCPAACAAPYTLPPPPATSDTRAVPWPPRGPSRARTRIPPAKSAWPPSAAAARPHRCPVLPSR